MSRLARTGFCLALLAYLSAVVILAADPWPPRWYEWAVIGAAGVAGLLVALRLVGVRHTVVDYAYLITGGAGLAAMFAYALVTGGDPLDRAAALLLLGSGSLAAYSAHLLTGDWPARRAV